MLLMGDEKSHIRWSPINTTMWGMVHLVFKFVKHVTNDNSSCMTRLLQVFVEPRLLHVF